jgi:hypothetical protein
MVAKARTGTRSGPNTAAAPARRQRSGAARRVAKKAFSNSAGGTGDLGVTASCRARARDRSRLRGSRLAYRRYDLTALRGDPWHGRRLSRTRHSLAADAATGKAPMKTGTRRSLRRVWRVMTWPLSGHIALALATGLACGGAASRYPDVLAPPYAAILGTLVVYPVMVAAWWRLNSPGGHRR